MIRCRRVTGDLQDCRVNVELIQKYGKRRAFHAGGNSSCRVHIRKHYLLYEQRCKDGDIPENHHALPRDLWRKLQEAKNKPKAMQQGKLDGVFKSVKGPAEFT